MNETTQPAVAGPVEPTVRPRGGDTAETLEKALRRAYSLGQTYWQQADSEGYAQNRRAAETQRKFEALTSDTREALFAQRNDGLSPLVDSEENPARLWAEIHRLRAEVAGGPLGYATWKDAAEAERVLRVKAEKDALRFRWLEERTVATGLVRWLGMMETPFLGEAVDKASRA
jgi:hypothetical protein